MPHLAIRKSVRRAHAQPEDGGEGGWRCGEGRLNFKKTHNGHACAAPYGFWLTSGACVWWPCRVSRMSLEWDKSGGRGRAGGGGGGEEEKEVTLCC